MKRSVLALICPPAAVYHYGCAGNCAAPTGVFWLAGVSTLLYGLSPSGASWLVALGVLMWLISAMWARLVVSEVEEDRRHTPTSSLRSRADLDVGDQDPLNTIR